MHLAQRCLSQTYLVLFWGNFSLSVLPSQSVCAFPSLEHQSQRFFCLFSSKIPHYSLQACEAPLAPKLWYASSLTPSCVKTQMPLSRNSTENSSTLIIWRSDPFWRDLCQNYEERRNYQENRCCWMSPEGGLKEEESSKHLLWLKSGEPWLCLSCLYLPLI